MISGSRAALSMTLDAVGEHGGHDDILGRADRDAGEGVGPAVQPLGRGRPDIAGGEVDLGAERLERLQVEVDRPIADRAAAGER